MELTDVLTKNRDVVIKKWSALILESYHPDTAKFIDRQKDRFANPVGRMIDDVTGAVLNFLADKKNTEGLYSALDDLVKLRAVQDFTPSEAVSFMFLLKGVLREELSAPPGPEGLQGAGFPELMDRVDELALYCFDRFMHSREKIYEIKSNELQNRTFRLLQKANMFGTQEEQGSNGG